MTSFRARYVTACQQLLALAVVLAMLAPASRVVSLDVVGTGPDGATVARPAAHMAECKAEYTAEAVRSSRVAPAPVRPHVRTVASPCREGLSRSFSSAPHALQGSRRGSAEPLSLGEVLKGYDLVG